MTTFHGSLNFTTPSMCLFTKINLNNKPITFILLQSFSKEYKNNLCNSTCYILSSAKCQNRSYKSIQQLNSSDDCFETLWPTCTYLCDFEFVPKKTISVLELLKVEICYPFTCFGYSCDTGWQKNYVHSRLWGFHMLHFSLPKEFVPLHGNFNNYTG